MQYSQNLELSSELEPYRSLIESTLKPYIKIKDRASDNLDWWQSKFGGLPYFPKGIDYPQTAKGEYLSLLAQINFAETPNLEGFPETGILQFYILAEGGYGKDYENPRNPDWHRVLYIPKPTYDLSQLVTDFSFLPEIDRMYDFPIVRDCSLDFSYERSPVSLDNFDFESLMGEQFSQLLVNNDSLRDKY